MYNVIQIFLLIPNLVCFVRVIALVMYALLLPSYPWLGVTMLSISVTLDALDGYLARRLNQTSHLGYILDYTLDRATIIFGTYIIARYCPEYSLVLELMVLLDITSHFLHLYASHMVGNANHKIATLNMPRLLMWYYNQRSALFFTCFFHDLFWAMLLLDHFYPERAWIKLLIFLSSPIFILKCLIHVMQLCTALVTIAKIDVKEKNAGNMG